MLINASLFFILQIIIKIKNKILPIKNKNKKIILMDSN